MLAAALVAAPSATLVVLMAIATTIYTLTFLFKFMLTWVGASRRVDMQFSPEAIAEIDDRIAADLHGPGADVPRGERAAAAGRGAQAARLSGSKLEMKLVLEEDDDETIDAAKALKLPGTFRDRAGAAVATARPSRKPATTRCSSAGASS